MSLLYKNRIRLTYQVETYYVASTQCSIDLHDLWGYWRPLNFRALLLTRKTVAFNLNSLLH